MAACGWFARGQIAGIPWWVTGLLIASALGGSPTPGAAQELNALATVSATVNRSGVGGIDAHLDSFSQTLDANWSVALTPLLSYRLGFSEAQENTRNQVEGVVNSTQTTTIEPSLDLTLRGPQTTASIGGRFRRQFLFGNTIERDEPGTMTLFARWGWTPLDLPEVDLQYEYFKSDDFNFPVTGTLVDENRIHLGTRYNLFQKLNLDYRMDLLLTDNRTQNIQQTQWQNLLTAGYADSYFDERLSVNLFYQPRYNTTTTRFAIPGVGEFPRTLSSPFSGLEPNPTTTDPVNAPLTAAPQLLDGNAATGVALLVNQPVGAALANTSVGFEVLTGDPLDTIRIVANPGFNPTQAPALTFRVLRSADRVNWTEIVGVSQTFDQGQNRFVLSFASATARFFKAFVATNTSLVPVQAVELEALGPGTTTAQRDLTTSNLSQNLSAQVTFRPFAFGALSYYLSWADVWQDPGSERANNWAQTVSLSINPHPLVSATAGVTRTVNDTNRPNFPDTKNDILTASVSSTPISTLTGTLSYAHTDSYLGGAKLLSANTGGLLLSSQLYRNLSADLNLNATWSEDLLTKTETTVYGTTLNMNGRLTERLQATLAYTVNLSETSGQVGWQTAQSGNVNLTYTVSRVLSLGASFRVANAAGSTQFTQAYTADWNPSERLSIFASYNRSDALQSNGTPSGQGGQVTARWSLSRNLDLNVRYQYFQLNQLNTHGEQHVVSGSVSFRL